jgi:putative endopeptidase
MRMKKTAAVLAAAVIGLAAAPAFALDEFSVKLNAAGVTKQPAVSEDYYLHQNFDWLKHNKIPATQSDYGSFTIVALSIEDRLSEITKNCLKVGGKYGEMSDEARIANLRACIADRQGRNRTGLGGLAAPLAQIDAVKTLGEYAPLMARLSREYGLDNLFGIFDVDADPLSADMYRVSVSQPELGLGKEFYEQQGIGDYLKAYTDLITSLLTLYGRPRDEAARSASAILALQQELAKHSLYKAELDDASKSIRRLDLAEMKKLYSNFDAEAVLNAAGVGPASGADVWFVNDSGSLAFVNSIYTPDRLQLFKDYAVFALLKSYGGALPDAYAMPVLKFNNFIKGVRKLRPRRELDDELCAQLLPFNYGRLYGSIYFTEKDKQEVTSYVTQVMDEYRKRLTAIDWLSGATKKQALRKLDTMVIRVGYPDKKGWPACIDQISVKAPQDGGTLIDNAIGIKKTMLDYKLGLLNKPVDRNIWPEQPQTVNAGYYPNDNSINFPAGILQPPFYDSKASRAANLGGVGMVIAHEITHSFDRNGSQYDEHGALRNWWTEDDLSGNS